MNREKQEELIRDLSYQLYDLVPQENHEAWEAYLREPKNWCEGLTPREKGRRINEARWNILTKGMSDEAISRLRKAESERDLAINRFSKANEDESEPRRKFTDTLGNVWIVKLTIGKLRKIKDKLGLDLLAGGDVKNSPMVKLADDPQTLCELLWALVNPGWPEVVIDEQAFWDSVDNATLEAATAAITEALLAFFRPGRRAIVQAALDLQTKTEQRLACQLNQLASDEGAVDDAAGQLLQRVKSNLQTLGT